MAAGDVGAGGASVIEGNVKAVLVNGVSVVSVRGRTHGTTVARLASFSRASSA